MNNSPEHLEQLIHQTLKSLPPRRAPRSLEGRVLAAIEARAALPWWRQSYREWPMAARLLFVLVSGAIAAAAIMATVWGLSGFQAGEVIKTFSAQLAWLQTFKHAIVGTREFVALVFRNIPVLWLYGGLAAIAAVYATLFGIGATAYRTLYANR